MDEIVSSNEKTSDADKLSALAQLSPIIDDISERTSPTSIASKFSKIILESWRHTLDFIYPPSCSLCMKATAQHDALCADCWNDLSFIERPFCERLGLPFTVDIGGEMISPEALSYPPDFHRARAVVRYDDDARKLIHRLKYNDRVELSRLMARMMIQAGRELLRDSVLILPVPLHYRRLWSRRFNQAAILSGHISRLSNVPWNPLLLHRRKRTRPQVGLTRTERARNLQGAFYIPHKHRHMIAERNILLIDDVLTTGATANACARALIRAGAKSVDVLVFARVVIGA